MPQVSELSWFKLSMSFSLMFLIFIFSYFMKMEKQYKKSFKVSITSNFNLFI